ncbi:hypothetical protein N7468_004479 [Penicillium chermesinum]|uniref:Thiolase-like protein type 1 additional C-terminal domain-containing protein n=1 Tax=Penicillium chermesinum TaxID=63820 RepID=A0A9W9TSK9_9EURO|nr:uncharacterized protein N7468_004479 [Penicillium chermesinum]KAJ5239860.1 hypothetical protein N7468_004479 [Penicillium chermesinum]
MDAPANEEEQAAKQNSTSTMSTSPKVPVLIGVGDFTNHSTRIEDAKEPMQLMLDAIYNALRDTGLPTDRWRQLQQQIDSVDVVATWSWPYSDLPGLIGEKLGAQLKHKRLSEHGGNSPGLMLHQSAARIADGTCNVALVTGGEALGSLVALHRAGIKDPTGWTRRPEGESSLLEKMMTGSVTAESVGSKHGVNQAIHVYPLYENALRAHRRQTYEENLLESAKLYASFSETASKNPAAWKLRQTAYISRGPPAGNPLLMNAFNNVNMASACLLTSEAMAAQLGIPQDRWVYPVGGAGFEEHNDFWMRPSYHACPSVEKAIDTALDLAGMRKDELDVLDVYSCFPIVPKLVCQHLGISITNPPKPITLLGGLTSFGGAGNNYSGNRAHILKALVAMTRELRNSNKKNGLVVANGGFLTHEHAIILSSSAPRKFGLPLEQAHHDVSAVGVPRFTEHAEGDAVIETYTVEFNRKGHPARGCIVGRLLKDQQRFLANHGDETTLTQLASTTVEPIGRKGRVSRGSDGRNLFTFHPNSHL